MTQQRLLAPQLAELAETFDVDLDELIDLVELAGEPAVTDWLGGILVDSLEAASHTYDPTLRESWLAQARAAAVHLAGRPGAPAVEQGVTAMSATAKELREWLATLPDDGLVGIDEGGLALQLSGDPDTYFECGGLPEDDPELTGYE